MSVACNSSSRYRRSRRIVAQHQRLAAELDQLLAVATQAAERVGPAERHRRTEQPLPAVLESPGELETDAVERDAVTRAFRRLSIKHRVAFVLRHYYGHSAQEVAEALRGPLGTAKSRMHYAERDGHCHGRRRALVPGRERHLTVLRPRMAA